MEKFIGNSRNYPDFSNDGTDNGLQDYSIFVVTNLEEYDQLLYLFRGGIDMRKIFGVIITIMLLCLAIKYFCGFSFILFLLALL